MHVHFLAKMWDQKKGGEDMFTGQHRDGLICIKLCKGVGADKGSQVDMHTYTDACTPSG